MEHLFFTKENFETEVLNAEKPVVVDFFATWCGPCKMLAPVLDEFAEENAGKYIVGKVDVDEDEDIAIRYGIRSVPTVKVFYKGEVVASKSGYMQKEALQALMGDL